PAVLVRHPSVVEHTRQCRSISRMSIVYALGSRLRDRLSLSGLTFLRKPSTSCAEGSHLRYRYLCRQGLFSTVHQSFQSGFKLLGMLSYHAHPLRCAFAASLTSLSPVKLSLPDRLTCALSCFLSCMLAYKPSLLL